MAIVAEATSNSFYDEGTFMDTNTQFIFVLKRDLSTITVRGRKYDMLDNSSSLSFKPNKFNVINDSANDLVIAWQFKQAGSPDQYWFATRLKPGDVFEYDKPYSIRSFVAGKIEGSPNVSYRIIAL